MSEWISVNEKLPLTLQQVLIYTEEVRERGNGYHGTYLFGTYFRATEKWYAELFHEFIPIKSELVRFWKPVDMENKQ
jgi:hypothetical protein